MRPNAWGKLPSSSPLVDRPPRRGTHVVDEGDAVFEDGVLVRSGWAATANAWASQNVHNRKVPSSPSRPSPARVAVDQPRARPPGVPRCARWWTGPWGCRRKEPDQRHHQAGGVEVVGAERLREGSDPLVPPLAEDGITHLVPAVRPGLDPVGRSERIGQRRRPIERHPAHQLGVHEVAAACRTSQMPWSFPPAAGRGARPARSGTGGRASGSGDARPRPGSASGPTRRATGSKRWSESRCMRPAAPRRHRAGVGARRCSRPAPVRMSSLPGGLACSVRSRSPPMPNMICSFSRDPAAEVVMRRTRWPCRPGMPPPTTPRW